MIVFALSTFTILLAMIMSSIFIHMFACFYFGMYFMILLWITAARLC